MERWRHDLEKSLSLKDRKIDDMLSEKERTISEVIFFNVMSFVP